MSWFSGYNPYSYQRDTHCYTDFLGRETCESTYETPEGVCHAQEREGLLFGRERRERCSNSYFSRPSYYSPYSRPSFGSSFFSNYYPRAHPSYVRPMHGYSYRPMYATSSVGHLSVNMLAALGFIFTLVMLNAE